MKRIEAIKSIELFNMFESGICILDAEGHVLFWNKWLANQTHINEKNILGKLLSEAIPGIPINKLVRKIQISLRVKIPSFYFSPEGYLIAIEEGRLASTFFSYMQQSVNIYPIAEDMVLLNIIDQTAFKSTERELADVLHKEKERIGTMFDRLTGLGSRAKLLEDLGNIQFEKICALVNLSGFNEINDFYGFEVGDKFLIYVADKLQEFCNEHQLSCYKLPSDEYAIVNLDEERNVHSFMEMIQQFFDAMSKNPFTINQIVIPVSLLAGVANGGTGILRFADIALKQAKKSHLSIALYDASFIIEDKYKMNMLWLNKLTSAMSADRIVPFFQPIVNNKTQKIEKYESLARMIDEDGKIISPFFFIDIAKRAKLYPQITQIMIEKTFAHFRHEEAEFSVNLSVDDILNPKTVALVLNLIKKDPIFSKRIVFEILESEGIENFDEVSNFINSVKEYGCKIAIDDFGTGYSNFFYLTQLNIDYLKIDGSLIKTVHQDRNVETVVEALIDLARKLDAKVIGEFVHCQEVLEKVQDLQIDYSQGFHLGEPKGELVKEQPAALKKKS